MTAALTNSYRGGGLHLMDVQAGDAGMDNMQFIVYHNDPSIDDVKKWRRSKRQGR